MPNSIHMAQVSTKDYFAGFAKPGEWLTLAEACALAGTSTSTWYREIVRGEAPIGTHFGRGCVRWRKAEVAGYVERQHRADFEPAEWLG